MKDKYPGPGEEPPGWSSCAHHYYLCPDEKCTCWPENKAEKFQAFCKAQADSMDAKLSGRWVPVSEAMPTRDDGRYDLQFPGHVEYNISFYTYEVWTEKKTHGSLLRWFHIPPAPPVKSAEDIAFEEAVKNCPIGTLEVQQRHFFDAGIDYALKPD